MVLVKAGGMMVVGGCGGVGVPGVFPERFGVGLDRDGKVFDCVGREDDELGSDVAEDGERWREARVDGDDVRFHVLDDAGNGAHNLHKLWPCPGESDFEEHQGPSDDVEERDHAAVLQGFLLCRDFGTRPCRHHIYAVDGAEYDGPGPRLFLLSMVRGGQDEGLYRVKRGEVDLHVLVFEREQSVAGCKEDIGLAMLRIGQKQHTL